MSHGRYPESFDKYCSKDKIVGRVCKQCRRERTSSRSSVRIRAHGGLCATPSLPSKWSVKTTSKTGSQLPAARNVELINELREFTL